MTQINLIQQIKPKEMEISQKNINDISETEEDSFEEHFHQSLLGAKEKVSVKEEETEEKVIPVNTKNQKKSTNIDEETSAAIMWNNLLGVTQPLAGQVTMGQADNQPIIISSDNVKPIDNAKLTKTPEGTLPDINTKDQAMTPSVDNTKTIEGSQLLEQPDLTLKNSETDPIKIQTDILPIEQDIKLAEDILTPLNNIKNKTEQAASLINNDNDNASNTITLDSSVTVEKEPGEQVTALDDMSLNSNINLNVQQNTHEVSSELNINNTNAEDISLKNETKVADNIFDKSVINQVIKGVGSALGKEVNEIKIALVPPHLGSIHIKVSMEGDKISTTMFTDNNTTKGIVESNMKDLKDAMMKQGLAIDQFTVTVGNGWGQNSYDDRRDMEMAFYAGDKKNNLENDLLSQLQGINNLSGSYNAFRENQMIDLFV